MALHINVENSGIAHFCVVINHYWSRITMPGLDPEMVALFTSLNAGLYLCIWARGNAS